MIHLDASRWCRLVIGVVLGCSAGGGTDDAESSTTSGAEETTASATDPGTTGAGSVESGTEATDTTGELHVFRHDCHSFGVNRSQVGVLHQ